MPQELIHINTKKAVIRILLILILIVAGAWSYYAIRWYLGNTLAEYLNPSEANAQVADLAASLAPGDPTTHWRVAQVTQKRLPLDQQAQAIAEYEKAVSLSPADYRFWMELGTAQEQAGDTVRAEQALKRAITLAPHYAYPRWYLGNLFIREGRYDEAFAELRLAAAANEEFLPQLFSLVWAIYSSDPDALKNAVGESATTRARFSLYLLEQQHFDEGMRVWNSLSPDEKRSNRETAEAVIASLKNAVRFHEAANTWNELMGDKYRAEVGRIFDGSFEEAVNHGPDSVFGWQVKGALQMSVGIDPNKGKSGSRSLRFIFQVRTDLPGLDVSQLVLVQPNTDYEFQCFVATEKLESGSSPQVQLFDMSNGAILASSEMAPSGDNDWKPIDLSFKTGGQTEAIAVRIVRISCSSEEMPVCPIYGSVWYDDFTLKRRN